MARKGRRSVVCHFGTCPDCGKFRYTSRKKARRAARANHPDDALSPYPCPTSDYWHYGRLKVAVRKGAATRDGTRNGVVTPNPVAASQIHAMWRATHPTSTT